MTGHNNGSGYRYTMDGTTSPGLIHEDNEVGALDAPRLIPAGGHKKPWYFDGTEYQVTNRVTGTPCLIDYRKWRI